MKTLRYLFLLLIFVLTTFACKLTEANEIETTPLIPTDAPTQTNTLPPPISNEGLEEIYIEMPGSLSEVVSPIQVSGLADATFEQTLVVKLTDIEGTVLALQATIINADMGNGGPYATSIPFIVNEETRARLSVYHTSPKDGGIIHLTSIPLTLLASGAESITSAPPANETILIETPLQNQDITGGMLSFSGFSEYFFESNLSVAICGEGSDGDPHEICGTSNNLLAESYATIDSADIGLPGEFATTIAYNVASPTHARLVVYARSPMDGGIEHLSSVEIVLSP